VATTHSFPPTDGPLVCLELEVAELWQGVAGSASSRHGYDSRSDYQRACGISDHVDCLSVGSRQALVLGDASVETLIWTPPGDLPRIVRILRGGPGAEVMAWLGATRRLEFDAPLEVMPVEFKSSPLVVFEAACRGSDQDAARLSLDLPAGRYLAFTRQVHPDERTSVLVHVFTPV